MKMKVNFCDIMLYFSLFQNQLVSSVRFLAMKFFFFLRHLLYHLFIFSNSINGLCSQS